MGMRSISAAAPLTLTLSPKGRGDWAGVFSKRCGKIRTIPLSPTPSYAPPRPSGERAGVRGFTPAARQICSSGANLGGKAMRAALEWHTLAAAHTGTPA
jgi:hypothetical protein